MDAELRSKVESALGVTIGQAMAYEGKTGCESMMCRRYGFGTEQSWCAGWHCARCGEPSSMYGHDDCEPVAASDGSEEQA